jgi:hypothetical protein
MCSQGSSKVKRYDILKIGLVKIVSYIEELFGFLFIAMKYHETIISISTGIIYCVLELEYVIKKIGTAMGSVHSPEVCDILMFDIL